MEKLLDIAVIIVMIFAAILFAGVFKALILPEASHLWFLAGTVALFILTLLIVK